MKLICLNCWGGNLLHPLLAFIKQQSLSVDIFCFQEVFASTSNVQQTNGSCPQLFSKLKEILPEFEAHYTPSWKGHDLKKIVDFELTFGLAIFVRRSFPIKDRGSTFVHHGPELQAIRCVSDAPRSLQYVVIDYLDHPLSIVQFQGQHLPWTKDDTNARLTQSNKVAAQLAALPGNKILCGDFNLSPETESLRILEKDMCNLIKKYKISSTRTSHFPYPNRFADYILVSPTLSITDFCVLPDEISDHSPLLLSF